VDRFGVWLSARAVRKHADWRGKRVADLGCGFDARFSRTILDDVAELTLVDVALAPDLIANPAIVAIEKPIEMALLDIPDDSVDVIMMLSVLEHLSEPGAALSGLQRVLAPGGVALVNVPSWRGKRFLEFSAFRLGTSPAEEMDDHKAYYDPRDLWPLLVRAGFKPSAIKCYRHKFGLNTFAVCRNS
jgi:SAM-dependent methyltransferase